MTKTKTSDVKATIEQIKRLEEAGCDIVRVTVNDNSAAEAMPSIIKAVNIPIVADIHFNHIFAIKSIEAGVSKVRINPGNIGSEERIKQVLTLAKSRGIPIRIGVNSGSLEKDILEKYNFPTAEALFESAMRHIKICEKYDFTDIVISVKSTDVKLMVEAYRLLSNETNYPLHLGVTEAGTIRVGTIKSAVGIGTLLSEGIGDTIRVSLTDEPEKEVEVGREILKSLHLASSGVDLIVCPTCGRLEVDLFKICNELEQKLSKVKKSIKIAVLGCAVNGIGEAAEADIGIACGKNEGILFVKGKQIKKIPDDKFVETILEEVEKFQ
jgi:(E)-4-hydroxy-3-methylbut-2-enyl-diphosphate synthase